MENEEFYQAEPVAELAELAELDECGLLPLVRHVDMLDHLTKAQKSYTYEALSKRLANSAAKEVERAANAGAPSWARVDPLIALEWADQPIMPTIGQFSGQDPLGVFYAGCINSIVGPSEIGKSWFAQYVAFQEMRAGHNVVYVDYEDDARSVYRRLKSMGMTTEELSGPLFKYHNPNGPLIDAERKELENSLAEGGTLLICDGVTEGMGLEGLDTYKGEDVATWHAKVTRDAAKSGWGVVIIDHTPHSAERAIGSQHKKASITGVSYIVTAPDDGHIDQGVRGVLFLGVEKDRHGSVRAEAARGKAPRHRGELVVDDATSPLTVDLFNAKKVTHSDDAGYEAEPPRHRLEPIMGYIKANGGCSMNDIDQGVKGKRVTKMADVAWLVRNGYVGIDPGPRGAKEHKITNDLPTPAGEFDE